MCAELSIYRQSLAANIVLYQLKPSSFSFSCLFKYILFLDIFIDFNYVHEFSLSYLFVPVSVCYTCRVFVQSTAGPQDDCIIISVCSQAYPGKSSKTI